MRFCVQLCIVFALAFLVDLAATWHLKALISAEISMAVVTIIAIHFAGYLQQAWFIDYRRCWQRLSITAASAMGAALGSAVVILRG